MKKKQTTSKKSNMDCLKSFKPRSNPIVRAALSAVIDKYKIRLKKIEKAADKTPDDHREAKAYKVSAANQTRLFISDLKKLRKRFL